MDTETNRVSRVVTASIFFYFGLYLSSCLPTPPATPFRPPTQPQPSQVLATTTSIPAILSPTPQVSPEISTTEPCTNSLTFGQDLTIPDGTTVTANEPIDKQWLVTNSGSCDWDSRYRLKLVGGDALGAPTEQALYPARAGTQVTLRITFTAPAESDNYQSAWQAFAPDGTAFGDTIFIQIVVQ